MIVDEPVTFTLRLSRKDHLWYFARHYFPDLWMPWLVGFGVSAVFAVLYLLGGMGWVEALIRFAVVGLSTVLLMFLLATLLYALRLRRFADDGLVLCAKQVRADAQGLTITHPGGSAEHAWSRIEWIRQRGRFVFLKLDGDEILLLFPLRDVPPGGVEALRSLHASAQEVA